MNTKMKLFFRLTELNSDIGVLKINVNLFKLRVSKKSSKYGYELATICISKFKFGNNSL